MNQQQLLARRRSAGFAAFFFSGICAISSGVVVSLLQEQYGFAYSVTGTLLSLMSLGNLAAGFVSGVLPGVLGMKPSVLLLSLGYLVGYGLMGFTGAVPLLAVGFFLAGCAKGQVINTCTVLVGNSSSDRTRGMNIMHSCYACGALLCPFLIAAAARAGDKAPLLLLAILGGLLWAVFALTPMEEAGGKKGGGRIDWSFLRSARFWLLVGLIFCQNAAETSVTGWMVTYFKDSGIIAGALSTYTVTVMWGATLIARMLIAFVFPFQNPRRAMVGMGAGCIVTYLGLMLARSQTPAILLLFLFAFAMAGMNPTAVAAAGRMTTVTSIAILLPAASLGAIVMPWIIGVVAEYAGLTAGMASNIVPCVGMLVFAVLVARLPEEENA